MSETIRIGILTKADRGQTDAIVDRIRRWADKHQWSVCFADAIQIDRSGPRPELKSWKCKDDIDLLFSLGGDGTMLFAVRSMLGTGVPIVGINIGNLGFITSVSPDDLDECLAAIERKQYRISELMMLQARSGEEHTPLSALNDVVIDKGGIARIIRLALYAEDQFVTSMRCDGLIIATPTGSTAYSLSVGGPIVEPTVTGIIVSPISPHTFAQRPMILPADTRLAVVVEETSDFVSLTVDGQVVQQLSEGQRIEIRRHPETAKLLRCEDYSFYELLRTKLHWGQVTRLDEPLSRDSR